MSIRGGVRRGQRLKFARQRDDDLDMVAGR
jgi:hypothetical protein